MTFFVILVSLGNITVCGAVVYQSRLIARLIRENSGLREAINALFIEAVWPPHDQT